MNKYIPYNITCPLASCSRSNTCARYLPIIRRQGWRSFLHGLEYRSSPGRGRSLSLPSRFRTSALGRVSSVSANPSHRAMPNIWTYIRHSPSAVSTRQKMASSLSILRCRQTSWRFSRKRRCRSQCLGFDSYEEQDVLVEVSADYLLVFWRWTLYNLRKGVS